MADLERRAAVELRSAGRQLLGYASVFNVETRIGNFTEVVERGAFATSLASGEDILLLADHDPARVLARTRAGTLRLAEDERGLSFATSDLPNTTAANDMLALVSSGNAGGASFAFSVPAGGERWNGNKRTLTRVNLYEVSCVAAHAAYPGTTISTRAQSTAAPRPRPARPGDGLMGILRAIADRFDPIEERRLTSWDLLQAGAGGFGIDGAGGQIVTHRSAEHALAAVTACVGAISSAIASLPVWIHRGDQILEDHPVARMIRRGPNRHQSWSDWLELTVARSLLNGNSISEVVIDNAGQVTELRPAPWGLVSIVQLPGDRIAFDVTHPRTSATRRLLPGEVFHLRDRADDDETFGVSRLQRAAGVVGQSQALAQFTGSMWRNGVNPSGTIEVEGKLGPEAFAQLQERWRQLYQGPDKAGRAIVLDQGAKWKQIGISPEDSELLQSRKFSVVEICRLYGVPPPIIQDYENNTFTNAETAGRWFAIFTLTPWIKKLEAEFARSVLSDGERIEFDLSGLLRGDPELRWKSHEIAARAGILTIDEIREAENYPPRGAGTAAEAQP